MTMPKSRNPNALRVTPAPFKPSFLSIPPSPCSPRTPLTPPPAPFPPRKAAQILGIYPLPASTAPPSPLSWIWTCHQCHRDYHLGATRRCLDDGHEFCSGTTTVKLWRKTSNTRRVRKHRACSSEFDYQGWKTWGRWRRSGVSSSSTRESRATQSTLLADDNGGGALNKKKKDCWNTCDYPSECRWGKKFGIHTPVDAHLASFEINVGVDAGVQSMHLSSGDIVDGSQGKTSEEAEKDGFWSGLLASTERRKNGSSSASSPLAMAVAEDEDGLHDWRGENTLPASLLRDGDGDVVMTGSTIDPSLLTKNVEYPPSMDFASSLSIPSSSATSSSTTSSAVAVASAAVDSFKALLGRKKGRRTRSSRSSSSNGERRYAGSLLTVPKPVVLQGSELDRLPYSEALMEGYAPLERVASRDTGYHCTVDVV